MGLTQVSTDGVKNDAITKTKIPANQIEASELADNAVDTNAIANNAVTAGKLASGVQTTINNNADNRVITGSGTANTLNGESSVVIDANSNVGIGTTSPTRPLHITSDEDLTSFTGTTKGAFCISNNDYASGEYSAIDFTYTGSDNPLARIAAKITGGGTLLSFGTSGNYSNGITNEALTIDSSGKLSTGGESAPDVSAGGLCLNQGTGDEKILTFKSSDIAHGVTTFDETDTFFSARKSSSNKGGVRLHALTDAAGADPAFEFHGIIGSDADASYVPFEFRGHEANGTGTNNIAADRRIAKFTNSDGTIIAGFTGTGLTFGNDTAAANALDDYEEGTWSPLWSNASSGGTTVSNNMYGFYTKVGRLVTAHFHTWGLPTSGNSDAMYLQGLPFTSRTIGAVFSTVWAAYFNMGADNYYNLGVRVTENTSYARLYFCRKSSGDAVPATFNGFINYYTNFTGTITYLTT